MKTTFRVSAASAVALVLMASVAMAHHSFAMFDASKTMTLEGTASVRRIAG